MAPLEDFGKYPNRPKPRIVGENAPGTFYQSLFALVLATLRFKRMSRGTVQGHENLAAIEFLESELVKKKGFQTVNLLTVFVKPEGASLENDLRLSPEFDLKSELAHGRVKALTKTDCTVWHDSRTSKHTSCFYNYLPKQFVGDYKNWVSAQPVEDWSTGVL